MHLSASGLNPGTQAGFLVTDGTESGQGRGGAVGSGAPPPAVGGGRPFQATSSGLDIIPDRLLEQAYVTWTKAFTAQAAGLVKLPNEVDHSLLGPNARPIAASPTRNAGGTAETKAALESS